VTGVPECTALVYWSVCKKNGSVLYSVYSTIVLSCDVTRAAKLPVRISSIVFSLMHTWPFWEFVYCIHTLASVCNYRQIWQKVADKQPGCLSNDLKDDQVLVQIKRVSCSVGLFCLEWVEKDCRGLNLLLYKFIYDEI
jgi:hypothetical protein